MSPSRILTASLLLGKLIAMPMISDYPAITQTDKFPQTEIQSNYTPLYTEEEFHSVLDLLAQENDDYSFHFSGLSQGHSDGSSFTHGIKSYQDHGSGNAPLDHDNNDRFNQASKKQKIALNWNSEGVWKYPTSAQCFDCAVDPRSGSVSLFRNGNFQMNSPHGSVEVKEKPHKCEVSGCDFSTSYKTNLKYHRVTVHNNGDKPFKCDVSGCDYSAPVKSYVDKHKASNHNDREKPFKCDDCKYSTASKAQLRRHQLSVHEGKKPFQCKDCDFSASQASNLRKHEAVLHSGIKRFQCSDCDYSGGQKHDLQRHVAARHTGERPFKCSECDFSFLKSNQLRKHQAQQNHFGPANTGD